VDNEFGSKRVIKKQFYKKTKDIEELRIEGDKQKSISKKD
jgi:hypothetical protein